MLKEAGSFFAIAFLILVGACVYIESQGGNPFAARTNGQAALSVAQGDSIQRAPTVSAQFIDQLLCTYPTIENHSPACGTGQNIYNLGVQYGIDPAVPLGFFWEESNFGTRGEAVISHSLGNLRSSPLEAFEADGYAQFYDWQTGERAWFVLIHDLYIKQWGLTTVPAILQRYAPSADGNNPSHYAQVVESGVSLWRAGKVALP